MKYLIIDQDKEEHGKWEPYIWEYMTTEQEAREKIERYKHIYNSRFYAISEETGDITEIEIESIEEIPLFKGIIENLSKLKI
jgi:hypothetical protein